MMILIDELPDKVRDAYEKWSEITEIRNLNSFFEDFHIYCVENLSNSFSVDTTYITVDKGKNYPEDVVMFHKDKYGYKNELPLWIVRKHNIIYNYLERYINYIDEQYENFRRTNTK